MKSTYIALILCISIISCQTTPLPDSPEAIEQSLNAVVDEVVDGRGCQGTTVYIEAPNLGISWVGFSGLSDLANRTPIVSGQPFRIASVTKTFTATAILRLMEMGQLSLSDPISQYISEEHQRLLREGGYPIEKITIRHCLNHTSGLYDYAMDKNYIEKINANTKHRWTRTEQIEGAMSWGEPVGQPGDKYAYSDTGYILLGEIIEQLSGLSLGEAFRQLIGYEVLDMQHTWLESLETAPDSLPDRIHNYYRGIDYYHADPSIDLYGGGGLVSTTTDLTRFLHALFNGKIFEQQSTLDAMLSPTLLNNGEGPQEDYRLGLSASTVYGEEIFGHSGLWGTHLFHLPKYNITLAVHNTDRERAYLEKKLLWNLIALHQEQAN